MPKIVWGRSENEPGAESTIARLWGDKFGVIATRSLQALVTAAIAIAIIYGITRLTLIVIPVLIALILASALTPLVDLLRRHKVPSTLATIIVLLLAVGVLSAIGYFIVQSVQAQGDELIDSAQEGFDQLVDWISSLGIAVDQDQFDSLRQQAIDFVTSSQFGTGALAGVSALGNFFTGFAIMIVTLFFFLQEGRRLWAFLMRPFEGDTFERYDRAGGKVVQTLGSYVRGTALVAATDSILIGIGLLIVGVPLVVPLVAIIFFTAFIPIIGALIAGLLAAALALVANGPVAALIIIAIVIGVNQLDGNVLQPLIQGKSLQLHPLVILLVLAAGSVLGGLVGTLLAVPIAASVWGVIQVWDGPNTPARFARQKRPETI